MLKDRLAKRRINKVNRYVSSQPDKKLKIIIDNDRAHFEIGDVNDGENFYPLAKDGYQNFGMFIKGYVNELQFETDKDRDDEVVNAGEEIELNPDKIVNECELVDTQSYKRFAKQRVVADALTPPDPQSLGGSGIPMWAIYAIIGILSVMTFAIIAGGL